MNHSFAWSAPSKFLFQIAMKCRRCLPTKTSLAFKRSHSVDGPKIEHIYVINLDRQSNRWIEMQAELNHVLDSSGLELRDFVERCAAVDARDFTHDPPEDSEVDPIYTLGDQLFVEPQPLTFPTRLLLGSPIRMSRPEIAIAHSHINVWRKVAARNHEYALVLEDDVWFRHGFAKRLDKAWHEIGAHGDERTKFDILYLSYEEVLHGAPKTFISSHVFKPVRGLWHLSGYIISREGAKKLLGLLPCKGPVDLWINHKFGVLNVLASGRSIISQRRDIHSTNSYSILPALTKIGAITSESASLFHVRPSERPIFVFGPEESGLSSVAVALAMLGYRCCSDLQTIPPLELQMLLAGNDDRVFDAYVNIGALEENAKNLVRLYPKSKFIVTTCKSEVFQSLNLGALEIFKGTDCAILDCKATNKWQIICEHLRCAPPVCPFPEFPDIGKRQLLSKSPESDNLTNCVTLKRDKSPWVIEPRPRWHGIHCAAANGESPAFAQPLHFNDSLIDVDRARWLLRDDTFTDNLALFRPSNIDLRSGTGATFSVRRESLGVREYSAAALSSRDSYLFGKFEAIIKASSTPGVVTGFFLHRDSPRQEIDIEITGNRTKCMLVNVFYNPGSEGAKFDYGYRGAASRIELGFDASEAEHLYSIEWTPCEIRWFVDNRLVHSRVEWEPTPIPNLPLALHVNIWPPRSKELAGRLACKNLPATSVIRSISLQAKENRSTAQYEYSLL